MAFSRKLTKLDKKKIQKHINDYFGEYTPTDDDISDSEGLFIEIEEKIAGRIAGDIQDYTLCYWMIVAALRRRKDQGVEDGYCANYLEIGVLFGGSAIFFWHAIKSIFNNLKIVLIDPLDGYYLNDMASYSSTTDTSTGLAISRKVLEENLKLFQIPLSDFDIIDDLSESRVAIERAGSYKYFAAFIDGDHSESGVNNDIRHYASCVEEGGLLMVDNILDSSWPGVTRAIFESGRFREIQPISYINRTFIGIKTRNTNVKSLKNFLYEVGGKTAHTLDESAKIKTEIDFLIAEKNKNKAEVMTLLDEVSGCIKKLESELQDVKSHLAEKQTDRILREIERELSDLYVNSFEEMKGLFVKDMQSLDERLAAMRDNITEEQTKMKIEIRSDLESFNCRAENFIGETSKNILDELSRLDSKIDNIGVSSKKELENVESNILDKMNTVHKEVDLSNKNSELLLKLIEYKINELKDSTILRFLRKRND